jgi:single-strand DNA-binding protein
VPDAPADDDVLPPPRNEVALVGRLAAAPEERTLPSGDALVVFRLVVDRPPGARRTRAGRRSPTVDTIDCAVSTAALRRKVLGWSAGDVLELGGALRRRFWRGVHGPASRCEVEVREARRLVRGA